MGYKSPKSHKQQNIRSQKLYEFACRDCGHAFEEFAYTNEEHPECPQCKSVNTTSNKIQVAAHGRSLFWNT